MTLFWDQENSHSVALFGVEVEKILENHPVVPAENSEKAPLQIQNLTSGQLLVWDFAGYDPKCMHVGRFGLNFSQIVSNFVTLLICLLTTSRFLEFRAVKKYDLCIHEDLEKRWKMTRWSQRSAWREPRSRRLKLSQEARSRLPRRTCSATLGPQWKTSGSVGCNLLWKNYFSKLVFKICSENLLTWKY